MKIKSILVVLILSIFLIQCSKKENKQIANEKSEYAIVIHGGAGNASRDDIPKNLELEYKKHLGNALKIGEDILKNNGTSLDAVEKTINYLENCPLFNSGKGAVYTHDGYNELDASIMDGRDLNAGAVAGVRDIKNPITAAREVMINSKHVLLSGKGASEFAKNQNLELVDSSYFYTEKRWKSLQRTLKAEKHGTVGCVALDKNGNLAAGTSTGGMTNKKYGRIGDSPIIGAGTYANNNTCAVSATGHGEFFIRYTVAHDISALIEYKNMTLKDAAELVINKKLIDVNGNGGIIAVDKYGNIASVFNTNLMFRASSKAGEKEIAVFK
ncbi:MAG: isoaspartyl peptidase/L-asparaginase [Bacteroidota bacterium]|nr:isoaspartyl peptidase/L-asparaginase [Bacteroidota bacterium]